MTVQEFITELEHWKRKAGDYKYQMEANLDCCKCYERALIAIAEMCGHKAPWGNCCGCPEDADSLAIRLVKELVEKQQQLKRSIRNLELI